jgi:hypothetical protein
VDLAWQDWQVGGGPQQIVFKILFLYGRVIPSREICQGDDFLFCSIKVLKRDHSA